MASSKAGGYGAEWFGDPFGVGGPLHVVRARAVAGQTVRVTFDEMPVHRSPSGAFDALNPANYLFAVVAGAGRTPRSMGVDREPVLPPTFDLTGATTTTPIVVTTDGGNPFVTGDGIEIDGVLGNLAANGAWTITRISQTQFSLDGSVGLGVYAGGGTARREEVSFDVHVDVQLVLGLTFRVTANAIRSNVGGLLGAPFAADFQGIVRVGATRPPTRPLELVDFASDVFQGGLIVASGDVAPQGGADSFRKRVFRRLTTPKNAFAFLPGYGLGQQLKKPFGVKNAMLLKQDAIAQIMQEPETASVDVSMQMNPLGALVANVKVKTKKGSILAFELGRGASGEIVIT